MIIINFEIKDKISKSKYFQKIFLLANTNFELILKIFFLKFSNTNISFNEKILI